MSSLLIVQTKDAIYMGSDSAVSCQYDDQVFRLSNNGKKLFKVDNMLIFCSGNMFITYEIIETFKQQEDKTINKLRDLAIRHSSSNGMIEIMVGIVDDNFSCVYQISSYNNFEIVKHIVTDLSDIGLWTGGFKTKECYKLAHEGLSNKINLIDVYKNTFNNISCEEIGGKLYVYKIDKARIEKLIESPIAESNIKEIATILSPHLVVAEQIFGQIGAFATLAANQIVVGSGGEQIPDSLIESATVWDATTTNFDGRNDRISATPADPVVTTGGSAIDHTIATDGSANISFEWTYTGTGDTYNIDGFIVYLRQSSTGESYTFGTTPSVETIYNITSDKRAFILYGAPANQYYTFGIQAYRVVDDDINSTGLISSSIVQPTRTEEDPYQPSSSVSYAGDVTGTVNGTAASTVQAQAANSVQLSSSYNAVQITTPEGIEVFDAGNNRRVQIGHIDTDGDNTKDAYGARFIHTNGSETIVSDSDGLIRRVTGSGTDYVYLSIVEFGTGETTGSQSQEDPASIPSESDLDTAGVGITTVTITNPDFVGREFIVVPALSGQTSFTQLPSNDTTDLTITSDVEVVSYDYPNTQFTIRARTLSLADYFSNPTRREWRGARFSYIAYATN